MNECCIKWLSRYIMRIEESIREPIEHLFKFCPECGKKLVTIDTLLEERIEGLRYCSWISDELFFKIRSFY